MAELAGAAVGIISLGLQVCQGIVSYSQAWRGYDEKIQNTRNKAESIRILLKTLRETIEELQQTRPEVAADLEEKAMRMRSSIDKLRKIIDRFKPARSEVFLDKVRTQLKKSVYYFQKDNLQDMQNHLDQIQNVLQTSLLIYNWQDQRESRAMQISIYEEMRSMHSTLGMAISSTDMPPPSVLQLACDSQRKQLPMMMSDSGQMVQKNLAVDRYDMYTRGVWTLTIFSNRLPNRRIWTKAQSKAVTRAYIYHSRLLSFAISASFSMIRGAGGLSIAPTLRIQSLWQEDSDRHSEIRKIIYFNNDDSLIPGLLNAFSEQRLSPYDTSLKYGGIQSLMDIFCFEICMHKDIYDPQNVSETIKFMLECGMKPKKEDHFGFTALMDICSTAVLRMEDLPLISNLIESSGPLQIYFPDLVQAPEIAKATIQQSEERLKDALESGQDTPNDKIGNTCPLELAFRWPKGIKILLQSGANPQLHISLLIIAEGEKYHASAALLLEAGYKIQMMDLIDSEKCNDGGRRYSLLINELAARRRRLCTLAESSLPLDQMPPLGGSTTNICRALTVHGIDIPITLPFVISSMGSTEIYQTPLSPESKDFVKIMDSMYDIGFHDVDLPDQYGRTPLMTITVRPFRGDGPLVLTKCAAWLMSKGASIERKLPNSNAKVAHPLTLQYIGLHESLDWEIHVFFVSPTKDCCICACSSGGCTTLSVALLYIVWIASLREVRSRAGCFRKLIPSLVAWQDCWPDVSRAIVRTLTVDALGLTHTCCTEIRIAESVWMARLPKQERDEAEINRILDDQHFLIKEFEDLMEEMESKLDEIGLPLKEFLDGYWYDRVIEYLSTCDQYDEEHVTEARRMGIFLEAEEFCIPDRVSLQLRAQVQDLQDDSLLDGPKSSATA
ncbi:hypothetical protein N7463_000751 [Penicillium fimorum]|uniref:Fungal N-terminal domain-containing protein n=1 Tax=Penicillium fimorum TaxID=1882269 RepID=A0A9W9Y6K1_9EURO|nr:hypothetical protein N7463_000751 [Penicillium fimorum]